MKKYFKHLRGFTLIELLIVIGILGVLAAAIVATLDPFEQIRKSKDSALKDTANEFLNASVRYYVANDVFPWGSASAPNNCIAGNQAPAGLALSTLNTCITTLINGSELKQGFSTSSSLPFVFISSDTVTSPSDLKVCFKPASKNQQADVQTKYTQAGVVQVAGTCKSQGGNNSQCFWCTQ